MKNIISQGIALRNKYLSAIIALLLSLSLNAQVTVTFPNLQSALDAMKLSTGTVYTDFTTKAQRDSMNLSLRSYITGTFTNLQAWANNTFVSKGSTGGTSEGQTISLPDQTWYKIIQPTNYGKTYANGSTQGRYFIGGYRDNVGVNFSTEREDKVFTMLAYNILKPNGSREFPKEAAWDFTVETHYDNSGFLPYGDFEFHIPRIYDNRGYEHRFHSIYGNKTNGRARHDFEGIGFTFMSSVNNWTTPQTFANLEPINDDGDGTGAFGQFTLLAYKNANSGGKLKFNHNGVLSSIEGNNGSIIINTLAGQGAYFDRMGHTFLGYNDGTTVFIGKEYDNRFIDRTKKLQVRGPSLFEGDLIQKTASGKVWKYVINETTGQVTAVQIL